MQGVLIQGIERRGVGSRQGRGEVRRKQPAAAAKERIMRSDSTEQRQCILSMSAEHLLQAGRGQ